MADVETSEWVTKLSVFRTELTELAFVMDRRGRAEAADVALMASARIGEICDELHPTVNASSCPERNDGIK